MPARLGGGEGGEVVGCLKLATIKADTPYISTYEGEHVLGDHLTKLILT